MNKPIPVIIVSYNTRDLLRQCLQSFGLTKLPVQLVVVDNASADGSVAMIRAEFPQVTLIEAGANLGFAKANNRGIQHVLADDPNYLLLLNPDAELTRGALETLHDFLEQHPRVGMVAPRLIYPDGTYQPAAFRLPTILMSWFDFFPPHGRGYGRLYQHFLNGRYPQDGGDQPFAIDHPLGAAMLVRAEAMREINGFDERYWLYAEEVDLAWRMKQAGWAIWQEPRATIIHASGASSSQFRTRSFLALQQARLQFFDRQYPAWFGRWHRRIGRFAAAYRTLEATWLWRRKRIKRDELRRRTWAWSELAGKIKNRNPI